MARFKSSNPPAPLGEERHASISEPRATPADDLLSELAKPQLKLVKPASEPPPAPVERRRDPLLEDRRALVLALREGDARAAALFFNEFEPLVERTIGRIIGFSDDLGDATQEAFIRALRSLSHLRDPQALVDWLQRIAVRTAADHLRWRRRRRWLSFFEPEKLQEQPAPDHDESNQDAVRATYRVLDRLSPEERTVFALRFIDGMEIDALASAHDCSRSTIKRRLARATARFRALAQREPALLPWVTGSGLEPTEEENES